ncbi:ComEA family DNA-binding protein [Gayadomonas joobiniege]|uniref:ComEA family DNA-binding protein n=1 Tax=Gayadomonas joobiniege TaxID=1234606 RepID=UPI00037367E1|nr:helix-hairpin-helix domain-containing protein [Gayadomonas joobiniege]
MTYLIKPVYYKIFLLILACSLNAFLPSAMAAEKALDNPQIEQQEKLNLKQATVKELSKIKGIGKRRAEAILQYVKAHPEMTSVDELKAIKGVGKQTLARIKDKFVIK